MYVIGSLFERKVFDYYFVFMLFVGFGISLICVWIGVCFLFSGFIDSVGYIGCGLT